MIGRNLFGGKTGIVHGNKFAIVLVKFTPLFSKHSLSATGKDPADWIFDLRVLC
jgi:hypothetical protein